jgi:hypothetical protein
MTLKAETRTMYAAARGEQLISDGYQSVDVAKQQARHLNEQMLALGLEPDVVVVEVPVTVKLGRPKPYGDESDAVTRDAVFAVFEEQGDAVEQ